MDDDETVEIALTSELVKMEHTWQWGSLRPINKLKVLIMSKLVSALYNSDQISAKKINHCMLFSGSLF